MSTLLDALRQRLAGARAHNNVTECPPVIVLWTDGQRKWQLAVPLLRKHLPNFWTWGEYDAGVQQGPAPWVKWRLGQIRQGDPVPILYLPGIERIQFRSLEDFPDELKPLAELQFRGVWWTQQSGKDWTPRAFLSSSKGGLGLALAEDDVTLRAVDQLIDRVLAAPLATLAKDHIASEDIFELLTDDLEGDLLDWLDDPAGAKAAWTVSDWGVFRELVRRRLNVDLDRDGPIVVAEQLVQCLGPWKRVWSRYVACVPGNYTHVHVVLEKANPPALFVDDKSTLHGHNQEQEGELRKALVALADAPEVKARQTVRALEAVHGARRGWVWAKLGQARLAMALEHLAALAFVTEKPVGGNDIAGIAGWYASSGWTADHAALEALALVDHADGAVIQGALRALYLPWLQRAAERLRGIVDGAGYPGSVAVAVEDGTCLLFADGLRWDVGSVLGERLIGLGQRVEQSGRWVAFPPVTATSKPDVSAIRNLLTGGSGAADFAPSVAATGKPLDSTTFRKLLAQAGVQVLEGNDVGEPSGRGWTEFGDIDKYGHGHGCKTARHVNDQLRELEQRVLELMASGWKQIRIVTDHGWLLVPGGMPPAKVPAGLAESRWGRCALLKSTSKCDLPSLPWAWDETVEVVYAPGVCAFYAGTEYAHGGLTLQECYTPVLTVTRDAPPIDGSITDLKWIGMRCKVKVTATAVGLRMDLRGRVADASSSLLECAKDVGADGTCSLAVPDDSKVGTAAVAVLLGPDGTVLDKRPTTIGGDA